MEEKGSGGSHPLRVGEKRLGYDPGPRILGPGAVGGLVGAAAAAGAEPRTAEAGDRRDQAGPATVALQSSTHVNTSHG